MTETPPVEPMLAHNVFFTLKDRSEMAVRKLVEACHKYLNTQPGIVFFACGPIAAGLERDVNDRDFDVALHIVFVDRDAHDAYQEDPGHKKFIEENRANWAKVRVFDSAVDTQPQPAPEAPIPSQA